MLVFADGGTLPIYETGTDFRVAEGGLSVTVVEAVLLDGFVPGLYWLQIELDGRERTVYPFRVVAP